MNLKLIGGDSAGTVTTYYVSAISFLLILVALRKSMSFVYKITRRTYANSFYARLSCKKFVTRRVLICWV
jgi:hypothetical protein